MSMNLNPLQQTDIPQISTSLNLSPTSSFASRQDILPYSISSPAKSDINTDASSSDIKSDMGTLFIKTENAQKVLRRAKKRVMCEKCQKSFYDKSGLKSHNSSVHLREMHSCTIPGCTKQFPSKRSRNRHSKNPNLHTDARRNCRFAVTSAIKTESSTELPPPHQQNIQNESSAQILFALLQNLISTPIQQASSPQTTVFSTQISRSESMPFPQHPLLSTQNIQN